MHERPPHFILLSWLWLAGLLLFLVMLAWDTGLLPSVLATDQTRISVLLLLITALASLHCGYRSFRLSRMASTLLSWQRGEATSDKSPLGVYLPLMTRPGDNNLSVNGELLAEHFHYQHA